MGIVIALGVGLGALAGACSKGSAGDGPAGSGATNSGGEGGAGDAGSTGKGTGGKGLGGAAGSHGFSPDDGSGGKTAVPDGGECTQHADCDGFVSEGQEGSACCAGTCTPTQKDYAGIYFCPTQCKNSVLAPPGSCDQTCHAYHECGGEGERACTVVECLPSCQPGLNEYGGKCTTGSCYDLHACGGEGQDACNVTQCLPSCRGGLTEYGGKCTTGSCYDLHTCGGEGQGACNLTQCFPSCSGDLKEVSGKCSDCKEWTATCSADEECCSGKCYATHFCPFGEVTVGNGVCCRDIGGNTDYGNCVPKTCGV